MVLYGLMSLIANLGLWYIVYRCWNWKKERDNNTVFFLAVVGISVIVCGLFYVYSLVVRDTIYYQDFACYYQLQRGQMECFERSFLTGIKDVIKSVWNDDYNSFMCIFGGLWYRLIPDKSVEAYIFEVFVWAIIPLAFLMAAFIKKVIKKLEIKNERGTFLVAFCGVFFMPLLHSALLQGMPDVFGLVFAFIILNIILEYDLKRIEWDRNILLVIASVALFITRRWYAFWIVSFYFCFVVIKTIEGKCREKSLTIYLKGILALGMTGVGIALVCLTPLFMKILSNNYAQNYSAYYRGGFPWEIENQISYLGIMVSAFVVLGAIVGIIRKNSRYLAILMTAVGLLSIFLFTRVQNAGFHQSLLFFTSYMVLFVIAVGVVAEHKNPVIRKMGYVIFLTTSALNWVAAVVETDAAGFLTQLSLKPIVRENIGQIQEVTQYMKEELIIDEDTIVYIIPHSEEYNPTVFSNVFYPGELSDNIPYGAAVLGVHKFPVEFLEADYIMTSEPILDSYAEEDTIVKNLDKCLMVLREGNKVEEIKRFSVEEGKEFVIYKLKEKITDTDIERFEEIFADFSKEYPGMFLEVLEGYKGE